MYKICVFLIGIVFSFAYAKHEFYEGHAVYEISADNYRNGEIINLLESQLNIDVWSHPHHSEAGQVLVPKELRDEFEFKLKLFGLKYKVAVENIKELLDIEDKLLSAVKSSKQTNITKDGLTLDRVYTYEEIDAYVELLGESYPDTVKVVNAGNSFDGRPIKYLKISTTNFEDTSKPVVYMESLLHAREWITQAATLYAIEKLIIDVSDQDLLNEIDWIIVPVANPDGYVHTHESFRYWRKNRSTGHISGNICRGVDLNRNFDFLWSTASSNAACSDTFHGPGGFSEPETSIVRDIIHEHINRMELFLDIHSFGSWILYGYGNGQLPANALLLHVVAVQMASAIDAVKADFNKDYVVGNIALTLYMASGGASDYASAVGVPLSYTFELPGYRGASSINGFLVDPEFVEQAGFETWEGIKVAARYALSNYRISRGLPHALNGQ